MVGVRFPGKWPYLHRGDGGQPAGTPTIPGSSRKGLSPVNLSKPRYGSARDARLSASAPITPDSIGSAWGYGVA